MISKTQQVIDTVEITIQQLRTNSKVTEQVKKGLKNIKRLAPSMSDVQADSALSYLQKVQTTSGFTEVE
jgi:hypothetical protein